MLYLMTNCINIIIIILLTIIVIIFLKAKQTLATSEHRNRNDVDNELYGNFTAIEFLKELKHFKPTYDTILIMQNKNATISNIFHSYLNVQVLHRKKNNDSSRSSTNNSGLSTTLRETATTTFPRQLMARLQVPVLQLNELQSFYLKRHYSEHLLSIVYIDINNTDIQMTLSDHKGLLEKLSLNLLHMRTSKVMFLLNFPWIAGVNGGFEFGSNVTKATGNEDVIQGFILKLFQHCWHQKIINAVAVLANYQMTRNFYSYTHFPVFKLEITTLAYGPQNQPEIYPYRLGNLKGYSLPIVIGGSDPRVIPYNSTKGEQIIGGFVGHFIRAFGKKYNCTLVHPLQYKPSKPLPAQELIKAVRNGTVEISIALTFPTIPFLGYSYPYEQLNWCIMIPVEAHIPGYMFFTRVFKGKTYLLITSFVILISMVLSGALYLHGFRLHFLDIFCHNNCLRGILGQPFSEISQAPLTVRFIYLQICALGILLTTSYNSHFSTYVINPPREHSINTFDDATMSGLKIITWEPEYKEISIRTDELSKYPKLFLIIQNFHEYLKLRDSFNTKYGYVMPTTKWAIVQEHQKIFTTPLFRQPNNFCFFNNIPLCFPVHENSLYSSLVYQLILETAQSGLTLYWTKMGFFEVIAAKKLVLKDLSGKAEFQAMTLDDLRYILIYLGGMLVLVNLIFLSELVVYYRWRVLIRFLEIVDNMRNIRQLKN